MERTNINGGAVRAVRQEVFFMATHEFSLQQLQPFLDGNPGRGVLRVQVSTASGSFPVPQALVEVAVMLGNARVLLYRKRTDSSGIADGFVLPAKPFDESQSPRTAGSSMANYVVSVSHPGYESVTDLPAGVFINTKTILPVTLTPATM